MRIIDTHTHAGLNWFEPVETLLFEMEANGVEAALLVQHGGVFDNTYLFDCARRFPSRFRVVVRLDPDHSDQARSLIRLSEAGAAGVRLSPEARVNGPEPLSVWKKAGELEIPVSCQGTLESFSDPTFRQLLDECPDTVVVMEHLAGVSRARPPYDNFNAVLDVVTRPNVYIKVPGLGEIMPRPARLDRDFHFDGIPPLLEMTLEAFGADRMMWGSDFPPVAQREGYRNALNGIMEHPAFSQSNYLEEVMGLTAARVWGFGE